MSGDTVGDRYGLMSAISHAMRRVLMFIIIKGWYVNREM